MERGSETRRAWSFKVSFFTSCEHLLTYGQLKKPLTSVSCDKFLHRTPLIYLEMLTTFCHLFCHCETAVRHLAVPPWAPHQRGNGRHVNTLYSRLQKLHRESSGQMITSLQSPLWFYSSININFNKSVWLYTCSNPFLLFKRRRAQPRGWVSVICWMRADVFALRAWNSLQ